MTFGEWLEKASGTIKVGTVDGANFFYCGTVEDVKQNKFVYAEAFKQNARKRVAAAKERVDKLLRHDPTPAEYIRAAVDDIPSENGYLLFRRMWFTEMGRALRSLHRRESDLREMVELMDREVKDVRMATAYETDCQIVIISGRENGAYWTTDEAGGCNLKFGGEGV